MSALPSLSAPQRLPPPDSWLSESVRSGQKSCSPWQLWERPQRWAGEEKRGHQRDPPSSPQDGHVGTGVTGL